MWVREMQQERENGKNQAENLCGNLSVHVMSPMHFSSFPTPSAAPNTLIQRGPKIEGESFTTDGKQHPAHVSPQILRDAFASLFLTNSFPKTSPFYHFCRNYNTCPSIMTILRYLKEYPAFHGLPKRYNVAGAPCQLVEVR